MTAHKLTLPSLPYCETIFWWFHFYFSSERKKVFEACNVVLETSVKYFEIYYTYSIGEIIKHAGGEREGSEKEWGEREEMREGERRRGSVKGF